MHVTFLIKSIVNRICSMRTDPCIFIPAAGLSQRLRPLTLDTPKPLLPILGQPLIERLIAKLLLYFPDARIGLNGHYHLDQMQSWVNQSPYRERIELFLEPTLLGSGGALSNAAHFFSNRPFIVYNSDIVSDLDLAKIYAAHCRSGHLATFAVHRNPPFAHVKKNLAVSADDQLIGIDDVTVSEKSLAYQAASASIFVYSPQFLPFLPSGASSVLSAWLAAMRAGHSMGVVDVSACYWNDVGSPDAYAAEVFRQLKHSGNLHFIHPHATLASNVLLSGQVVIEDRAYIENGVQLHNCIVQPKTLISAGSVFKNCVVGRDGQFSR